MYLASIYLSKNILHLSGIKKKNAWQFALAYDLLIKIVANFMTLMLENNAAHK